MIPHGPAGSCTPDPFFSRRNNGTAIRIIIVLLLQASTCLLVLRGQSVAMAVTAVGVSTAIAFALTATPSAAQFWVRFR